MLKIEIAKLKKEEKGTLLATFTAKVTYGEGIDDPHITLPNMRLVKFPSNIGVDAPIVKTFMKAGKKEYIKGFYPNKGMNELITTAAVKVFEALPVKVKEKNEG